MENVLSEEFKNESDLTKSGIERTCDICQNSITTDQLYRYKCSICHNLDICEQVK